MYTLYDSTGLVLRTTSLLAFMLAAQRVFRRGIIASWYYIPRNQYGYGNPGGTYRTYLDLLKSL